MTNFSTSTALTQPWIYFDEKLYNQGYFDEKLYMFVPALPIIMKLK